MQPCVFFDRDGVINTSPGEGKYVLSWDDFELTDGIGEAIQTVHQKGYLAVLVTSQKCVVKGLIAQDDLDDIHRRMQSALPRKGRLDAIYAYTGEPDSPFPAKPDPGMLHLAAKEHDIDLSRSWLVGDADRDISMGQAAGLAKTIRFFSEKPITVAANYEVAKADALQQLFEVHL